MLTIIDTIGFKKDHIAAFIDDQRVELRKINPDNIAEEVKKLKSELLKDGMKYYELKCSPSYREFVSVSDFPDTLKKYFK